MALVALPTANSFCVLPSSRLCVSTTPFLMMPGASSIRAKPEGPCASKEMLLRMQISPGDGRGGEGEDAELRASSVCCVKARLESSFLSSPLVSMSWLATFHVSGTWYAATQQQQSRCRISADPASQTRIRCCSDVLLRCNSSSILISCMLRICSHQRYLVSGACGTWSLVRGTLRTWHSFSTTYRTAVLDDVMVRPWKAGNSLRNR